MKNQEPLMPDEVSMLGFIREHGPVSSGTLARCSCESEKEILRHLKSLLDKELIEQENGLYRVKF